MPSEKVQCVYAWHFLDNCLHRCVCSLRMGGASAAHNKVEGVLSAAVSIWLSLSCAGQQIPKAVYIRSYLIMILACAIVYYIFFGE